MGEVSEVHMQPATLLAAITFMAGSTAAGAQELGDARKGLSFARKVCAECHAVLAGETVSPLASAPPFKAIANTPGMTAMALAVWFRTSHPTMPNIVIHGDDMDNITAYILSLRDKK
jgi:mono/diheme cytochrome c family protein